MIELKSHLIRSRFVVAMWWLPFQRAVSLAYFSWIFHSLLDHKGNEVLAYIALKYPCYLSFAKKYFR